MTRKHFNGLADAIAIEYRAAHNPNFDRALFLTRALPETLNV